MKQKTTLQIAIEEYEKYDGELISGASVASFLKSLLPTEREHIETAFNADRTVFCPDSKTYFTDNFQE